MLGACAGPRWGGKGAARHTREMGMWRWQSQFDPHSLGACWLCQRLQLGKASDLPTFNSLFYRRRQLDAVLHHELQRHRDLVKTILACKANRACNNYSDQTALSQPGGGQRKGCGRRVRLDPSQHRFQGRDHRPQGSFRFRPTSPMRQEATI